MCIKETSEQPHEKTNSNCKADHGLCFRYADCTISLLSQFPVSSHLLCLYSPVCVGLARKPHCCFSHEAAQLISLYTVSLELNLHNFGKYVRVKVKKEKKKENEESQRQAVFTRSLTNF